MNYESYEKVCGNCKHWGRGAYALTMPARGRRHGPAFFEPLIDVHPCDADAVEHCTGADTVVMLAEDSHCREYDCKFEPSAEFAIRKMEEAETDEPRPSGLAPWEAGPRRDCMGGCS
jgi:hypothetical protein